MAIAQVGINTSEPTETLDVNGNIRSRNINNNAGSATDVVVVADENGVLKTVDRGEFKMGSKDC
ncbi:hypothetical protein GO491_02955 [Flavobacteriaceae bacterium Ap0902]|nr:hypothetical protein [Flavobacteriaceae bacterium Ap0902]